MCRSRAIHFQLIVVSRRKRFVWSTLRASLLRGKPKPDLVFNAKARRREGAKF
jgi:hypothetical protein